ncbi:MAG: arylesterase [Gammaproteobacteria bacterium]|nr:arylesterase [Gammaproteobacteria bacterium]
MSRWMKAGRRFLLAPLLMAVAALSANAVQAATILIFGDSISAAYGIQREQGWVALLERRLANQGPQFRVVNASMSGETTGGGLARLPKALEEHDPDLLIIELGGNDGLRGYPVANIRRNLAQMIEAADPLRRDVLLVAMQIPPNYGHRYTQAFRDLFTDLSESYDVPLANDFIEAVVLQPELMQDDGIHPTAAGQPLLLDALWPAIRRLLAD